MSRGAIVDLCAVLFAIFLSFWHPHPDWTERYYTNDFYLPLDRAMRPFIDALPISVADLLLFAVVAGLVVWTYRVCRRSGLPVWRRLSLVLRRTIAVLGLIFVWFQVGWALNYNRVSVADKIVLQAGPEDSASLDAFADHVVRMLNADALAAHAEQLSPEQVHVALAATFYPTVRRLGDESTIGIPRVKPTVFNAIFRLGGEEGLMDPWTHEVNLYSGLFFYEWPALYAHEWSHASGFANEAEANYIATLACINSTSPLLRYSGWLLVWSYLPSRIHVKQRALQQVVDDIKAIQTRDRREMNRTVSAAADAVYDRYLKANRVTAGLQSYELFVRWLREGTYDSQGLPRVRSSAG